jgi:hypothetical protein
MLKQNFDNMKYDNKVDDKKGKTQPLFKKLICWGRKKVNISKGKQVFKREATTISRRF